MRRVRIGCGSGYLEDRLDPALEIIEKGNVDYIVFEALAEATLAGMQLEMKNDPSAGYAKLTVERMQTVLPLCAKTGTKVVSSMGGANPIAARDHVLAIVRELKLPLRVAVVVGDDLLEALPDLPRRGVTLDHFDSGRPFADIADNVISANVYLGADPIVDALRQGADVIITGRVTDSALYLAPMIHALGWRSDDWNRLATGVIVGHLLECAGHVVGGNYHGPEWRDIDYAHIGHGIGEVDEAGGAIITKLPTAGGLVSRRTCIEQLLYETHDPRRFMSPDVVADFSDADFLEEGKDSVRLVGVRGLPRPATLKALIGYQDGFIAEGQASYGWPEAVAKAQRAAEVIKERLAMRAFAGDEILAQLIGVDSLYGPLSPPGEPFETRLRIAAKARDRSEAEKVVSEMATLYDGGPQGAAGILGATAATRALIREVIAIWPALVPRDAAPTQVLIEQA